MNEVQLCPQLAFLLTCECNGSACEVESDPAYSIQNMISRRSKQRDIILHILKSTTSHPTAEWIYNEARKELPNISLGTVYRNLKLLKDNGDILQLEIAPSFCRYDGNPQNHYHFRCEQCQRVFDVDIPIYHDIDNTAAEKTQFEISHHILEFRGLCHQCRSGTQ